MVPMPIQQVARVFAICCVGALVACSPAADSGEDDRAETPQTSQTTSTSAPVESVTSLAESASPAEPANSVDSPPEDCQVLTDFRTDVGRQQWLTVNDDVMGGQSDGGLTFVDDRLVFEGTINTDGGGFASLRLPLEVGSLTNDSAILIRASPDERTYMLTLDDQAVGRNRRVTHRATINFSSTPAVARQATLPLSGFAPAIFGQPVDDSPIEAATIDELGLMISDGVDGPFRLEVWWIASCP